MLPRINAGEPPDQFIIWARSAVPIVAPANDTSENQLVSIPIPAGVLGPNGIMRLSVLFSSSGVSNKTFRAHFSGLVGTSFMTWVTAQSPGYYTKTIIYNRRALNAQAGGAYVMTQASSAEIIQTISAVDTSQNQSLVITGQKVTGADVLTLEAYLLELLPTQ